MVRCGVRLTGGGGGGKKDPDREGIERRRGREGGLEASHPYPSGSSQLCLLILKFIVPLSGIYKSILRTIPMVPPRAGTTWNPAGVGWDGDPRDFDRSLLDL